MNSKFSIGMMNNKFPWLYEFTMLASVQACVHCWRSGRLAGLSLHALGSKWKDGGPDLGVRRGLALGEGARPCAGAGVSGPGGDGLGLGVTWARAWREWARRRCWAVRWRLEQATMGFARGVDCAG
ncbi:unnamed protein product [Prunus armeniaca]